jgi:hypothetical protein
VRSTFTLVHYREFVMSIERKVAVITGASQGIGAGLVQGFLGRGYRVVANSRSIKPDAAADVLTVAGDITDPTVADRVIGDAAGSTRSSITPGCSSPSRSPSTPGPTSPACCR